MARSIHRAFLLTLALSLAAGTAAAQDRRQNEPGKFDFYVLSLSWLPTYCQAAAERAPGEKPPTECDAARSYPFVVHGLWPQYETGFPEFCQQPAPRLNGRVISSVLDLMPAPALIFNEWDRHGTCSGLSARAYFGTVRKARALVKIPDEYIEPTQEVAVAPAEIQDAFVRVNPGLNRSSIAISCDSKRLIEVRICVGKDMHFHDCQEVEQRSCRRDQIVMPPLRAQRSAAATP